MTTRTGFLTGMLALSVTAVPFPGGHPATSRYRDEALRHRCTGVQAGLATEWRVMGEWRPLAPYPVPREASPTSETGVWVERWHLDDGRTELRRVSAQQTEVAVRDLAGCAERTGVYRRHFNAASMRGAFTDASLDSLLRTGRRGMIYVWSPRMPLSVSGLANARAAARALGLGFTALVSETDSAELAQMQSRNASDSGSRLRLDAPSRADTRRLESVELVYRNATIHYPSVLLYGGGRVLDGVYPGYKNQSTYMRFAEGQFDAGAGKLPNAEALRDAVPYTPKMWVDRSARVTTVSTVNTVRRIGFFFKPITGTSLISYTSQDVAYFFDIATGKEKRVPGHVDPVPTPDGRFLTLPGLLFIPVPALLAGTELPMLADRDLPDEYQTASILGETRTSVRYRVVTGWNAGARFRDYDVTLGANGTPTGIKPLAEPFVPCADRMLTLPINAKSGREFGAYDAATRSNVVLEVTDSSHCVLKLDLGFASGKLSFSYDGAAIAFATSRINTNAEGELVRPSELFHKDALVLVRKTGRIVSLSQNEPISALTFPEFQKDGTVMLLDQAGPGRPVEQIRVVRFK